MASADGVNLDSLPEVGVEKVYPIPLKKFTPNGNLVALYKMPVGELSSGLILPGGSGGIDQSPQALVIARGPDCKWVKEGDVVLFGHNMPALAMMFHQKSTYWVTTETNISGVVLPEFVADYSHLEREKEVTG